MESLQYPLEESFGRLGVPPRLNEYVEDYPILINGPPKIMLGSLNPDKHLIHVPLVAWSRPVPAHMAGEGLTEFLAPAPHGLIGYKRAPFGEKQLNLPKTEAKCVVQPHSVTDDLGREVAVVRVRWRVHPSSLAGPPLSGQTHLTVTMPSGRPHFEEEGRPDSARPSGVDEHRIAKVNGGELVLVDPVVLRVLPFGLGAPTRQQM